MKWTESQNFQIVPVGEFFHLTCEHLYVTLHNRSSCFAREKQDHSLPNGAVRRLAHDNCSRLLSSTENTDRARWLDHPPEYLLD